VDVLPDQKKPRNWQSRVPPEGMALSAACQFGQILPRKRETADSSASCCLKGLSTAATNHVRLQTNRAPRRESKTTASSLTAQRVFSSSAHASKRRTERHEATASTTFDEKSQFLACMVGEASQTDVSIPACGKVKSLTAVCAMTSAGVLAAAVDSWPGRRSDSG
jgi:hypothetical protein